MKTALIALSFAALMGLASYVSGFSFNAAQLIAVIFVAGVVAWTFKQYSRQPLPLATSKPIRLSIRGAVKRLENQPNRVAA